MMLLLKLLISMRSSSSSEFSSLSVLLLSRKRQRKRNSKYCESKMMIFFCSSSSRAQALLYWVSIKNVSWKEDCEQFSFFRFFDESTFSFKHDVHLLCKRRIVMRFSKNNSFCRDFCYRTCRIFWWIDIELRNVCSQNNCNTVWQCNWIHSARNDVSIRLKRVFCAMLNWSFYDLQTSQSSSKTSSARFW